MVKVVKVAVVVRRRRGNRRLLFSDKLVGHSALEIIQLKKYKKRLDFLTRKGYITYCLLFVPS